MRIGAQLSLTDRHDSHVERDLDFELELGWRVGSHFEIGPALRVRYVDYADGYSSDYTSVALGPHIRCYFLEPGPVQPWIRGEVSIGFDNLADSPNYIDTELGPGLTIFVTPSVAFEVSLQWWQRYYDHEFYADAELVRFTIGMSTFL
jgi:hypothetical protein